MSTEVEQIQLDPCHRTRWPNITNIPVWETVVARFAENDHAGKRRGWREAWDGADRDAVSNGRTVCLNDDLLCRNCIGESELACLGCKEWECERCRQDTESEVHFRRWHEDDPRVEEDEYGRRGPSQYHNLDVQACFICRRRICKDNECKCECYECHRRACMSCKRRNDLKSWCGVCRHQIEELGDDEIGPQDREEWICRNCFDSEPHFCGCGESSYDPNAPESDNESRSSEWHDYF